MTLAQRTCALLVLAAAAAGAAAVNLSISYDLASFLPRPTTPGQRLLVNRMGQDSGADAIYVVLPEASETAVEAAAFGLRALPGARRVLPEPEMLEPASIPRPVWHKRLLLHDLPTSEDGWREVLEARIADSTLADTDAAIGLIAADPLLASISALEQMASAPHLFGDGGTRYLLILPTAAMFDIGAHAELVAGVRATLDAHGFADVRLYGSGVYSVDLQSRTQREARLFSSLATIALATLLYWHFRRPASVVAAGSPMLAGAAAGLVVVSLLYEQVHGIALAFGFTLLGVAVDYPLHALSHRSNPGAVWATLRLGIGSTLIAYSVFLAGGAPGLQQLGVFALAGIAAAALATAWLTVGTVSAAPVDVGAKPPAPVAGVALRHWLWVVVALAATVPLIARGAFLDDLDALAPVPRATLAADVELRRQVGANDMRYLTASRDVDLEGALRLTETVAARLDDAVLAGEIEGHRSISPLLPSRPRQRERMSEVRRFLADGGVYGGAFARATADLPFAADAFQPFHDDAVGTERSADWLSLDDLLADPELASLAGLHLVETATGWTSLTFLSGIADPEAVAKRLNGLDQVQLVDLAEASGTLVVDLRRRVTALLAAALLTAGVALCLLTRDFRRSVWLLGNVAAALATTACLGSWLRGGLSPFDLMALALVAGLGLDYGLFHSRTPRDATDAAETERAVTICALSSFVVFALLGFSGIPVLAGIGQTVAAGVAASWALTRFGRYPKPGIRSSDSFARRSEASARIP